MGIFQVMLAASVMVGSWAESTFGVVVVENPRESDLWRHHLTQQLVNYPAACFADLDMCQYQLTSCVDGSPLKKAVSLLTNNNVFADRMTRRCDPGEHEHRAIQGKDTAFSAAYPTAFANAVVRAYDASKKKSREVSQHFPTAHRGHVAPGEEIPVGAKAISFKGKVKPIICNFEEAHQNLGHPPTRELIRRLRLNGSSEGIIRAAEQMVCRTCEKHRRPRPARVAQPHLAGYLREHGASSPQLCGHGQHLPGCSPLAWYLFG